MDTTTTGQEIRSSVVSRKLNRVQQKKPIVIDVPVVSKMDFRMVNNYPEGTDFIAKQNDGKVYNCRISKGRIYHTAANLTEL